MYILFDQSITVKQHGRRRYNMVYMNKKKGETKDSLFRKFTRSFIDEDVVTDVRKKLFYKKPSLVRQEEEKERLKSIKRGGRPKPVRSFRFRTTR